MNKLRRGGRNHKQCKYQILSSFSEIARTVSGQFCPLHLLYFTHSELQRAFETTDTQSPGVPAVPAVLQIDRTM